jgi:hypothetical protein
LPHKFKPSNHSEYDGKTQPKQWLKIYSQSIELAGGDDNIKALFFPMALENMPLQWFDKLNPGSIRGWDDFQRAFCENFTGIITHPITHAELKGFKQKGGESLRDHYRRFGELCAQVHDITEREVIEAFSHGIMAKWQFQDFCKENLRNNEEFRCTVEKMIMTEEKTKKRSQTEITEKTTETIRTEEIFQMWVIQIGNVDQTTPSSWPTR